MRSYSDQAMPDGNLQKLTEQDMPYPPDPYAQSKYKAEQVLQGIAAKNNLEAVIMSPPLIYGAGSKLLSVPASLIRFISMLIGQQKRIEHLFSCLVIDSSKIYCELGWKPSYKMQQALRQDFSSITY